MSSNEEDLINEELESLKPSTKEEEEHVTKEVEGTVKEVTITEEEQQQESGPNIEINTYLTYLGELLDENQKGQSERAKSIVESGDYEIKKTNGEKVKLTYNLLNRKQDEEVRSIQRKYNKIRILTEKLRNSYLDSEKDPKYQEFKVTDYLANPNLKTRITGESSREEVQEALDEVYEELFSQRLDIFIRDFFGISDEQIDEFMYKELTFIAEVAFSEYSTQPY